MKYYSLGEIFRLKLLFNSKGKPYSDKATISKVVRLGLKYKRKKTPYGEGIFVSEAEILKYNRHW